MTDSLNRLRRQHQSRVTPLFVAGVGAVIALAGGMFMLGPGWTPPLVRLSFFMLIHLVLGFVFGALRPQSSWQWGGWLAVGAVVMATFAFGSARWVLVFMENSQTLPPLEYGWQLVKRLVLPTAIGGIAGNGLAHWLPEDTLPFHWLRRTAHRLEQES